MKVLARFLPGTYALFGLLVPLAASAGTVMPERIVPCNGVDCTCSHLVQLIQNIINGGIVIVIVLSALSFAYAGFLYVSNEAVGKKDDAKKLFTNVAMGLVVMLGAWLVVDTLMNAVLDTGLGPWNAIQPVDAICQKLGVTPTR